MNDVLNRVRETVKKYDMIKRGDNVVTAFSGGPDSMCLLHVLHTLKDELGINILAAVHINHMYRGEAAFRDERACEDFCRERDIMFRAYRYDIDRLSAELKLSSEETGRKVRYEAFARTAEELGGAKTAVAHNREDQAETLLMRLVRGTGTEGLCGIDYVREGGIIRPLLNCSREEIEQYSEDNGLKPCIDATNLQPIYTRNVMRLQVIPYINEKTGGNLVNSLAELSEIAKEERDFISGFTADVLKGLEAEENGGHVRYYLQRETMKKLHPAVRKRVVMKAFAAAGLPNDITSAHLEAAERLLTSDRTTGAEEFPHGFVLKCRYDRVYFEKLHDEDTPEYTYEYEIIEDPVRVGEILDRKISAADTEAQYFDLDRIESEGGKDLLRVRTRRSGDTVSPKGFSGTKKLKNYFIDRKIDRDLRDRIPLLCLGSRVLWIFGYEVNEKFIPRKGSRRLLKAVIIRRRNTEEEQFRENE